MKANPHHLIPLFSILFLISSCNRKQTSNDSTDISGLKDFPKEWVLVDDIAPPDSISRNYVIPVDSSNSFLGGITIKENGNDWEMVNSGFYYPGKFIITSCKKESEGEMIYYNFELQSADFPTQLKIRVNFRHNRGQSDDVPSVFSCLNCDNPQDVLLIEKTVTDQFPKKSLGELQYD